MVMVAELLPGLKRFLNGVGLWKSAELLVMRMIVAFVLHSGRMSCLAAAGAIRCDSRHRAQLGRFLARRRWQELDINGQLRRKLLCREPVGGTYLFIVDATLVGQSGKKTENTYSTGNRKKRKKKGRRYGKYKHARRSCHSFTGALLITPSGVRIPFFKPYRTKEYCERFGFVHRTTAQAAADMIRELPLPEGARVVVLGDTAYDSREVRGACAERGFSWIFPCNPERVLAGPKGNRPKVRSLLKDWSKWSRRTIKVVPCKGKYAEHRRLSKHRIGPKAKARTYYVHQERREVHSVGEVLLVFSTTNKELKSATPDDVKILMTNDLGLKVRDLVELYSLRWQIELFFKELKSTLGFDQYQFKNFAAVEGWVELALTTVLYLEWLRVRKMSRRGASDEEKEWWRRQRTHGLCQAVRMESQEEEIRYIAKRLETDGGTAKLKRLVRNGFPAECRAAA